MDEHCSRSRGRVTLLQPIVSAQLAAVGEHTAAADGERAAAAVAEHTAAADGERAAAAMGEYTSKGAAWRGGSV